MIDTGSNVNLVRKRYCAEKHRRTIPVQKIQTIAGITETHTACRFPILEFNNEYIDFLEIDFNNNYDGLIGTKLLNQLGAQINFKENTLTVNHMVIPLEYESDGEELTKDLKGYVNSIVFKDDSFRLDHLNREEKTVLLKF